MAIVEIQITSSCYVFYIPERPRFSILHERSSTIIALGVEVDGK